MDYGDKPAAAKRSLLTPPRWSLFAPPLTTFKKYLPPLLVFGLLAGLYLVGALNVFQKELTDLNYRLVQRSASDELTLVVIDSQSLNELDRWPWPRSYHARVVENLIAAGARQVAFDVDFSSSSSPEEDARLEQALATTGGRVILPAFKQQIQGPGGAAMSLTAPLPRFQLQARVGTINVFAERDGLVRRAMIRDRWDDSAIPSLVALLAGRQDLPAASFHIDFGLDLGTMARLYFADVMAGRFDPAVVAGKDIIIGSTAIELGDMMPVPVLKTVPGPVLLALAYNSLVQGRALLNLGSLPVLAIVLLLALVLGPRFAAWPWPRSVAIVLGGSGLVVFGAVGIYSAWPLLIDTAPVVVMLALLFATGLVSRTKELSLKLIFQNLALRRTDAMMRGVVENSLDGILTAKPSGEIATVNDAALKIFGYRREELVEHNLETIFPGLAEAKSDLAAYFQVGVGPRELVATQKGDLPVAVDVAMSHAEIDDEQLYIGIVRDITERKKRQEELQHLALYDPLTELPNRILLRDRLDHALRAAKRENKRLGLLLLDLDGFKEINDTLGHHMGDEILKSVAWRLAEPLRKSDTIARLGGDEFAILLPAVNSHDWAERVAERCLKMLEEPFQIEDLALEIGASAGIALHPDHADESSRLMQCADVAMYLAKRGQERIASYDAELDQHTVRSLTMKGDLRQAIEKDELDLHYQPKIDMKTGRVCDVEALIRWIHPEHGFQNPEEYVALAEQTGLIRALTHWVVERAFSRLSGWHAAGIEIGASVNLLARNLHDHDLPDIVATSLENWRLDPARVTLEITESAIMLDPERALETVRRLDELGVRLSIDDFGTGYSSLGYLKRLPVDELKIDKSFVLNMTEDEGDAVIVQATIDLAHNMGLEVVAESVEEQEHIDLLDIQGCDIGQGYFISKPMPETVFLAWLDDCPWEVRRAEPDALLAGEPAATLKTGAAAS